MNHDLGKEKVNRLLWQLSIPAILGMLSSAIFNIVDRIFVGKISTYALTAVGITMPVQILQMAFILLIGIGSSALISLKLGQGDKDKAEDILYMALKYILYFLVIFAVLYFIFSDQILGLLAISSEVMPYAKIYLGIIIGGSIIGIPGYCLNNSLRSIGQAKVSMKIIVTTSIINIILDPLFIFVFDWGIAGAAIATVISQSTLTIYVIYTFIKRTDFMINLKHRKIEKEADLLRSMIKMGSPSFFIQILATVVNLYINQSLLRFGTDIDIASVTIISSIFSFYHMVIVGMVQGNNAICGYNFGAKKYERVRKSLLLALGYAFLLSLVLYLVIMVYPYIIVNLFTDDQTLSNVTASGIKLYLAMLPLVGLQTVSSQYYQAVGKAKRSSMLSFLRYGVIVIPAIIVLAPNHGVHGIYISNAVSDCIASLVSIGFIVNEIVNLKKLKIETMA